MTKNNKKRTKYAVVFIALLLAEVLIALYVQDSFVRPYIGDILVVMVLYAGVRVLLPEGYPLLPLYIFIFATTVECLQYFKLVTLLGVENNTFLRILLGTTFDVKDILCYGVGCLLLGIYQRRVTY
ncbi:MAG TPA: DUF2809 domain-containing protein [Epulopiscium sp.]|nr:DUF2809 domain-containing protein [Candidatus Epulonipiscium sp.]